MEGQRTLTIGITVNLENYENLRLEVSGTVQNERDADELAWFLDGILQKFGQNDPSSRERVESFRKRILPQRASNSGMEHRAADGGEQPRPAEIISPATEVPPQVIIQAPEKPAVPLPSETGDPLEKILCEECGAPVKPAEQKMSMLFASRTLCRKCLKNV